MLCIYTAFIVLRIIVILILYKKLFKETFKMTLIEERLANWVTRGNYSDSPRVKGKVDERGNEL
jgi:hypothetical protein